MARALKELPRLFYSVWEELTQRENMFWINRRDKQGKKDESDENLGLMYLLKRKLEDDLEKDIILLETALLSSKPDEDWQITLPEYGKKVVYDKEAKVIYIDDMTTKDFRKADEKDNKLFLENRNKKGA